jgi:hypothetical protein
LATGRSPAGSGAPQHRPARHLPWLRDPDRRRSDLIKVTPGNIFLITMIR